MVRLNAEISSVLIISLIALAPVVDAGCCSGGTWDPSAFLNSEPEASQPVHSESTHEGNAADSGSSAQKPMERASTYPNGEILKPMKSVSSSDVVIDVSNDNSYAISHIKDAIHIPSRDFINSEGDLKTVEDLARILGDAGVSSSDTIVLYSGQESLGGAEFAFLVLRYLGQNDVKLLDGSLADWKAAGLPEDVMENKRPAAEYKPAIQSGIISEYEYVKSGQAQIIDVRLFTEFGKGRIPGSIALDLSNVINGGRIKDKDGLSIVFSRLDKDKPIVVYSDDYSHSALAAFALQLMGYKAGIYSWQDWKAHEATQVQSGAALSGDDAVGSKYTQLGTA